MTWAVTPVAETEAGHVTEHPLAQIEREGRITPASLGMRVAVEKIVLAALQIAIVTAQVEREGETNGSRRLPCRPHGEPKREKTPGMQDAEAPRCRSRCYLALRQAFQLVALRSRSCDFKDLEILVLRHALAILRRQTVRRRSRPWTGFS